MDCVEPSAPSDASEVEWVECSPQFPLGSIMCLKLIKEEGSFLSGNGYYC